ncbi:kinase-like domain-containing protein [Talaromyces proteolyticus]|uniref:Kinase-like domain-containing protein n=1 Tax=Talaromyces proteolyticus TaxID=1131652 RepID=A0AAD4KS00_9EURO|nr:kinase-like domain-containing protein [Talaromyces proteolyticus]KAH8699080.1 kinase-like domain-containing protein [Talaromyces proteolyticus]
MSAETISSLCELFLDRLRDNSSWNHHRRRFLSNGTAQEVFRNNQRDLRKLLAEILHISQNDTIILPRILESTLATLSNVLAILIWIRAPLEVLGRFRELLPESRTIDFDPRDIITDGNLPISRETASRLFPHPSRNVSGEFYENQFRFYPENSIGEGSFGRVWKVRIEKGHVKSHNGENTNAERLTYARKDFELNREQAFREETNVLQRIMESPRRHVNVVVALASLHYGSTYSLFFPLASCNLWEYLIGENVPVSKPTSLEDKSAIFYRGATLAGALAFLHHEFQSTNLERLACYHMDLKPHNILVFDINTPQEKWKISDFGLSRVRGRGGVDNAQYIDLSTPFLRSTQLTRPTRDPSTAPRRGEGTYLAPECAASDGRVSSSSDVWSFGCIFSLVMSFLDSGTQGVEEFRQLRRKQEAGDFFYVTRHGKPMISPFVTAWFQTLKDRSRSGGRSAEHAVVCQTLEFLQNKVLLPQPRGRVSALEVEITLEWIGKLFFRRPTAPRRPSLIARFKDAKDSLFSHSSVIPPLQPLPVSKGMLGSMFSPNGELLLYYSRLKMEVFVVDQIREAGRHGECSPDPLSIPTQKREWEHFAISSNYICASVRASSYQNSEFYIYPVSALTIGDAESSPQGTKVIYPSPGSIEKIAMTHDGNLTAFILTNFTGRNSEAIIYLFYTQDLLGAGSELSPSLPGSRTNSSASSVTSESIFTSANRINRDARIGLVERIRSLTFSGDGRYLVLVAQSQQGQLLVRAWETYTGTPCAELPISHPGLANLGHATFTACSVFNKGPNLALVLQRRQMTYLNLWERTALKQKMEYEMLVVFVQDDDQGLVFLGNNGIDRVLRVFALPIFDRDELQKPTEVAKIGLSKYESSTDSAVLAPRNMNNQRVLLIATVDGSFVAVSLPASGPVI